jgi:protein-S-isoprenylcysteine O-methyltransferase Ste14
MRYIEYKQKEINNKKDSMVHFVLLHSYLIFLFAIIIGVFLDSFINKKLFSNNIYQTIGLLMLFVSSIIIYWAQRTSSFHEQKQRINKNDPRSYFQFGPYKYLRSPTHFGLFIMALGFSLIINSFFSVVLTIIAHFVTKIFFIKKEEILLEEKYGQVYRDYKRRVRNWI